MAPLLSSLKTAARVKSSSASLPKASQVRYVPQPWEQEREWQVTQSIEVDMDLIAAAKQHLNMLRDVDKWQCLYNGPALTRAVDRLLPPLHTYRPFYTLSLFATVSSVLLLWFRLHFQDKMKTDTTSHRFLYWWN